MRRVITRHLTARGQDCSRAGVPDAVCDTNCGSEVAATVLLPAYIILTVFVLQVCLRGLTCGDLYISYTSVERM